VQSGLFPDAIAVALSQDAALACFLTPPEAWEEFIPAATHGCLNKDSNLTMRGSRVLWYSAGMTLHELAAEYAIRHSVKILEYYYEHNPHFMLCTAPDVLGGLAGCARSVGRASERNLF
jgi:hypothetical protein